MSCGISTACFYPMETLKAFETLKDLQVKKTEIFFNTFSEIKSNYVEKLQEVLKNSDMQVVSLHPFTSAMETFFFASEYETRFSDGEMLYRRMFEVCNALGAKILVYHGDFMQNKFEFKKSCENYHKLYNIGLEYGVSLCQENVVRCKCGLAENIILMRDYLNDEVEFVFDLKQSIRSGEANEKMLNAMKGKLRHIHISDYCDENDCILPGKGNADFNKLANLLQEQNYQGDIILELYKNGYDKPKELVDAIKWLETLGKPFA